MPASPGRRAGARLIVGAMWLPLPPFPAGLERRPRRRGLVLPLPPRAGGDRASGEGLRSLPPTAGGVAVPPLGGLGLRLAGPRRLQCPREHWLPDEEETMVEPRRLGDPGPGLAGTAAAELLAWPPVLPRPAGRPRERRAGGVAALERPHPRLPAQRGRRAPAGRRRSLAGQLLHRARARPEPHAPCPPRRPA